MVNPEIIKRQRHSHYESIIDIPHLIVNGDNKKIIGLQYAWKYIKSHHLFYNN